MGFEEAGFGKSDVQRLVSPDSTAAGIKQPPIRGLPVA
jgi:hypothetical protein